MSDLRLGHSGTYQLKLVAHEKQKQEREERAAEEMTRAAAIAGPPDPLYGHYTRNPTIVIQDDPTPKYVGPQSIQCAVDELVEAVVEKNLSKVKHSIAAGVPIDKAHTILGYSAIHAATSHRDTKYMDSLLYAGARVKCKSSRSMTTALHAAAMYGNEAGVRKLLAAGANRHATNVQGQTAQDIAMEFSHSNIHAVLGNLPLAPTNVRCRDITSSSLYLEWDIEEEEETRQEGPLNPRREQQYQVDTTCSSTYQIHWTRIISNDKTNAETHGPSAFLSISTSGVTLTKLMSATKYNIQIQRGNAAGFGALSPVVTVMTAPNVPEIPRAPEVTEVGATFVQLRIHLSRENGAKITKVRLQMQCKGTITQVYQDIRNLAQARAEEGLWENAWTGDLEALDSHSKLDVRGLFPGRIYFFRLSLMNQVGWSATSIPSVGICTNDVPQMIACDATNVTLVWPKPFSLYPIDKYELQSCTTNASGQWHTISNAIENEKYTAVDLIPVTGYTFRVRPHYHHAHRHTSNHDQPLEEEEDGWESWDISATSEVYHTLAKAPEAPEEGQIIWRDCSSVKIQWSAPRCNGAVVQQYELQVQKVKVTTTTGGSHVEEPRGILEPSTPTGTTILEPCTSQNHESKWHVLRDDLPAHVTTFVFPANYLERGATYQMRMRARNVWGWSQEGLWSNTPVSTYRSDPPTAPTLVSRTSHSLTVAWTTAVVQEDTSDPHSQKCSFEMQHQTREDGDVWTSAEVSEQTREWTLSGLGPLSWHAFRIRQHDPEEGWGGYSHPSAFFQTKRRM